MDPWEYSFTVGNFKCLAINDGYYPYERPAKLLFPAASPENLKTELKRFNIQLNRWEQWLGPYNCLFVDTGLNKVLVDTGMGPGGDSSKGQGRLLAGLAEEGIAPGDIDTVIISHAHPDHLCGNIRADGQLAFPGASFIFWKEEWEFWTTSRAEEELPGKFKKNLLSCARQQLPPLAERVRLMEREEEIVPGIKALAAPGHTPGLMVAAIASGGEQVFCVSDLLIHPLHVEYPEWYSAIDIDPEQNIVSRRRILRKALVEKALLFGFHFPFPGLGRVSGDQNKWHWKPVE